MVSTWRSQGISNCPPALSLCEMSLTASTGWGPRSMSLGLLQTSGRQFQQEEQVRIGRASPRSGFPLHLLTLSDWKCQIRLFDQSVEYESNEALLLNIFWPQENMPDAGCGDVVVIRAAKVRVALASFLTRLTKYDRCNNTPSPSPYVQTGRQIFTSTRRARSPWPQRKPQLPCGHRPGSKRLAQAKQNSALWRLCITPSTRKDFRLRLNSRS